MGGGGYAARLLFCSLFPVQQTTSRIGHPCKVVFRVGNQYAECEKQQQFFPLTGGCSEGLGAFRFFFKQQIAEDGSGQDWMGGYTRWPEAYLVTLADRCSLLCVSGQRGTIAKSMHEEHHLCVVALTSMERGTQFFPLASYRLV